MQEQACEMTSAGKLAIREQKSWSGNAVGDEESEGASELVIAALVVNDVELLDLEVVAAFIDNVL